MEDCVMGVKRLRIKDELHYRPGGTGHHCSACNHYLAKPHNPIDLGLMDPLPDPRCRLIGLKPGRQYRINPKNICDRYDNSNMLKRLKGY